MHDEKLTEETDTLESLRYALKMERDARKTDVVRIAAALLGAADSTVTVTQLVAAAELQRAVLHDQTAKRQEAERKLKEVQAATCARCGLYKHTPIRSEDGYICVACVCQELSDLKRKLAAMETAVQVGACDAAKRDMIAHLAHALGIATDHNWTWGVLVGKVRREVAMAAIFKGDLRRQVENTKEIAEAHNILLQDNERLLAELREAHHALIEARRMQRAAEMGREEDCDEAAREAERSRLQNEGALRQAIRANLSSERKAKLDQRNRALISEALGWGRTPRNISALVWEVARLRRNNASLRRGNEEAARRLEGAKERRKYDDDMAYHRAAVLLFEALYAEKPTRLPGLDRFDVPTLGELIDDVVAMRKIAEPHLPEALYTDGVIECASHPGQTTTVQFDKPLTREQADKVLAKIGCRMGCKR